MIEQTIIGTFNFAKYAQAAMKDGKLPTTGEQE